MRNPQLVVAAGLVRDSIMSRLRARSRYNVIPADSVSLMLSHTRVLDSLRAGLNADMWVTIYATASPGSDSVKWDLTLRDFTAHSSFATQGTSSKRVVMSSVTEPGVVSPLADAALRSLEMMDRAPRKDAMVRTEIMVRPN